MYAIKEVLNGQNTLYKKVQLSNNEIISLKKVDVMSVKIKKLYQKHCKL